MAVLQSAQDWAIRSEYWLKHDTSLNSERKRRERNSKPLVLCGHGVSLRVENGTLVIRDGFTHYPQEQAAHRFFPGSRDIPQRILLLDGSGTLSFDVLSWLGEQGVALARVKWTGEVAVVASGTGFASDAAKVRWQNDVRSNEPNRLAFAADLIKRKMIGSIGVLEECLPLSTKVAVAIDWHRKAVGRLSGETFADMNDVRAIEGQCASQYFLAWNGLAIHWKGSKPIPDAWRSYTGRSSLANGSKPQNRNASHPINAMLNYAYTVKQAQMQIQAVADGYDPTIGIMHHGRRGKPSFIFDLIEPERPKIDAAILRFVQSEQFAAADFILLKDGGCRLSPQLARMVARIAIS